MIKIIEESNNNELLRLLHKRTMETDKDVVKSVEAIIDSVRRSGDEAVLRYTRAFDGVEMLQSQMELSDAEISAAYSETEDRFKEVIKKAADNIRGFHSRQMEKSWETGKPGAMCGQMIQPIQSVGVYVPGGKAAYPSSVLMNIIPATIAGVENIIMVTPPNYSPASVVAAVEAGVHRIFKIGGAQAVAALAYGTETIPTVDKITGPGNAYVAEAKRQVFGRVGIDMIAGPSEVLIIADESADAVKIAIDMLAQAEHDENAASFLLTNSKTLAQNVARKIDFLLRDLPRQEIASHSINNNGCIIITESIANAIDIANKIAPEHLELCVKDADTLYKSIKNAGAVFLGNYSPEALGDYFAGTNHVLPTSGSARFFSPLGVYDFIKRTSIISYDKEGLQEVFEDIAYFARQEKLTAHAKSIEMRFEGSSV